MTSPKNQVLLAYESGATTRREIVAITHLDSDLVDLIIDILIRSGELNLQILQPGCRSGGCRGCWQSKECITEKDGSSQAISLGMPLMPN